MKILFVAPRLPLPANTGAKIRTFNLLKAAASEAKVTLLSFYFEEAEKSVETIKNLGIEVHLVKGEDKINPWSIFSKNPISIQKYCSKKMRRALGELVRSGNFDLIHFDHLHMGQYREYINGLPCILDEHNVESIILKRCSAIEPGLAKRIVFQSQAKKMGRFEGRIIKKFSKCLTVSEKDRDALSHLSDYPANNIEVISNGVDTDYFNFNNSHFREQPLDDTLVFTGSMDWLPNSDAVEYFCNKILPLIWKVKTDVKFCVVGKNPSKRIANLSKRDKRIIVTGEVDDVRTYMAGAKVFVAPIRIGGGTRLKILEAMAMRKAVVSTTVGAEGIAYTKDHDIILKDSPKEFADYVLMLLENSEKRNSLGEAGRKLVCEKYDWKIIAEKLNAVYQEVINESE